MAIHQNEDTITRALGATEERKLTAETPNEVPWVPLELRLTPAPGSSCNNSPTDKGAAASISSRDKVITGPTADASVRAIREPVTVTSASDSSEAPS